MSTINPLFTDSTKSVGQQVVTNIELFDIILNSDDSLYVEILDEFQIFQKIRLLSIPTKKTIKYRGEIWLNHQTQFSYRFIIETRDRHIYFSKSQQATSGNHISEKWESCSKEEIKLEKNRKHQINKKDPTLKKTKSELTSIKSHFQKPLSKPVSFEEIDDLIKDLL